MMTMMMMMRRRRRMTLWSFQHNEAPQKAFLTNFESSLCGMGTNFCIAFITANLAC